MKVEKLDLQTEVESIEIIQKDREGCSRLITENQEEYDELLSMILGFINRTATK